MTGPSQARRAEIWSYRQCLTTDWRRRDESTRPLGFNTPWWPFVVAQALELQDTERNPLTRLYRRRRGGFPLPGMPKNKKSGAQPGRSQGSRVKPRECGAFLLDP